MNPLCSASVAGPGSSPFVSARHIFQAEMLRAAVLLVFDERAQAERAVAKLEDDNIEPSNIRMVEGRDPNQTQSADASKDDGFMATLKDMFTGSDDNKNDHDNYAEGLRRGGYLVSVKASPAVQQRVRDILNQDGSVYMNERSEAWRSEGSTHGGQADETIQVVDEEMRVGKRDVDRGSVSVNARTVEEDVTENVTLETERAAVERRPVDRELTAANADEAFRDRTIEVEETSQEAVVGKTAHVTEEIHVGKDVEAETQTVKGTVRHTEVDVDDNRKGHDKP